MSPAPRYKRILLKLSGEVLMGEGGGLSIDPTVTARVAEEIADVKAQGYELCIVVGGGNIFRGISGAARGMERATGDYMGMLATVMNALAVQNALEQIGVETRVQSAIPMSSVCEPFIRRRAMRHLEKGRIVIFAAGVGSPFFTTDSGAALRAADRLSKTPLSALVAWQQRWPAPATLAELAGPGGPDDRVGTYCRRTRGR